jgi:tetrahydromethanopterin S-methyltransferase subunit C
MKNTITYILGTLIIASVFAFCGCASTHSYNSTNGTNTISKASTKADPLAEKAVVIKRSIFGLELAPGIGGSSASSIMPSMGIGLIRTELVTIPKCKSGETMPEFSNHVKAHFSFVSQDAEEDFSTLKQSVSTDTNQVTTVNTQ